ncbi:MAG: Uncharacterised protein [Cryomorphaceae bacterium]|nr:MAG: Uncharacterised protein [Cryomorphaceae bacterium]
MKKALIIFSSILMVACSSPLDKKYTEDTFEEDAKELRNELDSNEAKLLLGSIFRLTLQQEDLSKMTYGEILENGKAWKAEQDRIEAEQKALQEKAAREEAERVARLQNAVMVTCFKKGYTEVDYQDYITYGFAIQNKSDQDIRAVKGEIMFTDLFDDEIKTLSFTYDQPIKAGATANWNATTDYNQFRDEDVRLRNKNLEDLKIVWKPIKVIFQDGSTLE